MDDYLSKPIDRRKLAALLEKWQGLIAAGAPLPAAEAEPAVPVEPEAPGDPLVDEACHEDLADALGAEEFHDLLRRLMSSLDDYAQRLDQAMAAGDAAAVATVAHAVKGAALNLGLIALGNAAKALEMAGKAGRVDALAALLAALYDARRRTEDHLRAALGE